MRACLCVCVLCFCLSVCASYHHIYMSQETGFQHTYTQKQQRRLLPHTHTLRPVPTLVGQHVHKADREHAASRRVSLDFTLHPVLVVGPLVQYNQHLAFLEFQLVVVVRIAVVQGPTAPVAAGLCATGVKKHNN